MTTAKMATPGFYEVGLPGLPAVGEHRKPLGASGEIREVHGRYDGAWQGSRGLYVRATEKAMPM